MGHKRTASSGLSNDIFVTGAKAARNRGGRRSPDPKPPQKRQRVSSPDPPRTSASKRAVLIKAKAAQPLFTRSESSEDEQHWPDDGLDADEQDGDNDLLSPELVDFVTGLRNGDLDTDDDDDPDYQQPARTSHDEDDDDDGEESEQDTQDSHGDDDEDDEPPRASRPWRGDGLQMLSSTPTRVQSGKKAVGSSAVTRPAARSPSLRSIAGHSAGDPATPYTPYTNRVNPRDPSKPLLTLQSPTTRNILKRAQQLYRADIVTQHAFPEDESRVEAAAKYILKAANELGAARRVARFQGDPVYQDNTVKIVKRTDTQVRGEVVSSARDIIGAAYSLGPGLGSPEQNKRFIELLTTQGNFVYRVLETEEIDESTVIVKTRSGPYRHPVIATLIQQEWFNGHEQMAVADLTTNLFNPIPLPVIAIAATALQCALRDWSTGVRVKSTSDFTSDEWSSVYNGHLRELTRMLERKPLEVDAWTRKLWRDCWCTTSQSLAGGTADASFISAAEMDDFDDVLSA